MRLADSWTPVTVSRIEALVSTVEWVADWIAAILAAISSVARAVRLARLFPSWAPPAKPRPAWPGRAAPIVASKGRWWCWSRNSDGGRFGQRGVDTGTSGGYS